MTPDFFRIIPDHVIRAILSFLQQEMLYTSILFGVILGLSIIFRKASPYWHFGLWALVLVRFLLPPDFALSVSLRQQRGDWPIVAQAFNLFQKPAHDRVPESAGQQALGWEEFATDEAGSRHPEAVDRATANSFWLRLLFTGWMGGCLFFSLIFLTRFWKYVQVVRRAEPVTNPQLLENTRHWRAVFRIKRPVQVVTSAELLTPFTIGLWRPRIFLPRQVTETLAPEQLAGIIAHEMVHIRHGDALWLKIQNLVQIIYFFHPVVWIANRRLYLARECICDHQVLVKTRIPVRDYGRSILQMLQLNLQRSEPGVLVARFGQYAHFKLRIQNLKRSEPMTKIQLTTMIATVILLGIFLLPMATSTVTSSVLPETAELTQSGPFYFVYPLSAVETGGRTIGDWIHPENRDGSITILPVNDQARRQMLGVTDEKLRVLELVGIPGTQFGFAYQPNRNQKILAVMPGKVRKIASGQDEWINLVLEHANGWFTQYGPVARLTVSEGQTVAAGTVLGEYTKRDKDSAGLFYFAFLRKDFATDEESLLQLNSNAEKIPAEVKAMKWKLPLSGGKVTARYGFLKHPIDKDKTVFHKGIDLAARKGTPVFAAADGRVNVAEAGLSQNPGAGKHLLIDHAQESQTFYSHLDSLLVGVGQLVQAGEKIALVGNTGVSTGPHLHFEIRTAQGAVNPQSLIDFTQLPAVNDRIPK